MAHVRRAFVRKVFVHEPPVPQKVPNLRSFRHFAVVRDHEDGGPRFFAERNHEIHDLVGVFAVEVPGGFVGEKVGDFSHERPGNGYALFFSAGKFARIALSFAREADFFKDFSGRKPPRNGVDIDGEVHVFFDREVRHEFEVLKNERDVFPAEFRHWPVVERPDVGAVDNNGSPVARDDSRHQKEEGGLSGTGRPHDRSERAVLERKIETVENLYGLAARMVGLLKGSYRDHRGVSL